MTEMPDWKLINLVKELHSEKILPETGKLKKKNEIVCCKSLKCKHCVLYAIDIIII